VTAESALQDLSVFGAIKKRSPLFQLSHALGSFLGVDLAIRQLLISLPPRMVSRK